MKFTNYTIKVTDEYLFLRNSFFITYQHTVRGLQANYTTEYKDFKEVQKNKNKNECNFNQNNHQGKMFQI